MAGKPGPRGRGPNAKVSPYRVVRTGAGRDDFVDPKQMIDSVQVYPDADGAKAAAISRSLRGNVGRRVTIEGKSPFGAHTGHHHAPLLLPITKIEATRDPHIRRPRE
jgi:uncharacterized protein DUF4431